jgi:hypothetical protein
VHSPYCRFSSERQARRLATCDGRTYRGYLQQIGERWHATNATFATQTEAMRARAGIRRMLREDGVITTPERSPPARKPDRIITPELRIAALERVVAELRKPC